MNDLKKVAEHWNSFGDTPPKQWLHSLYLRRKVLLDPLSWHGGCWFNWVQRKYFPVPASKALSLCCGSGRHERRMAQVKIADQIDGMDVSPGQLERAQQSAIKEGYDNISYIESNIQKVVLPVNEYDIVFVIAGLHHLENLNHVFKQIHSTLKENGVLVITEYIGPDHMDYSPWERELYQKAFISIPEVKRVSTTNGKLRVQAGHQTRKQAIARDPSEGVNSSKIMPELRKFFDAEIEINMGSSLLRECLYDIVDSFDDKEGEEIIDRLVSLDRELLSSGLIESHHVFGVYRPNSTTTS